MPLCRVDVTENIFLDSLAMVQGYLHVLKKSLVPRDYKLEKFHKGKAKDIRRANQHSHCLKANHVTVLAYDKVDQLKMIGRGDELIDEKAILRIEIQMKQNKIYRTRPKEAWNAFVFWKAFGIGVHHIIGSLSGQLCGGCQPDFLQYSSKEFLLFLRYIGQDIPHEMYLAVLPGGPREGLLDRRD